MDRVLSGQRALVCGASQGIGRACAEELARLGAEVCIVARSADAMEAVVAGLDASADQKHDYLIADFSVPDAMISTVRGHLRDRQPFSILVNNTGGPPPGPILDASVDEFRKAIAMHLECNHLLVQAITPSMKEARNGRIINVISASVKEPLRGLGVSNTTRWAVAAWAKTMAGELAPFGITVNNVLPGYILTDRLKSLAGVRARQAGVSEETMLQSMIDEVPAGRIGKPSELAAAVGFLASPAAAYISGINLPVDGGRSASL